MPPKSRPKRKRKQSEQFSPMRPEEEKELNEVLFVSLRKIPENGNVSEDDLECADNKEEIIKKRIIKEKMAMKKRIKTITNLNGMRFGNQ